MPEAAVTQENCDLRREQEVVAVRAAAVELAAAEAWGVGQHVSSGKRLGDDGVVACGGVEELELVQADLGVMPTDMDPALS